ncbi:MAG: YgiT-type zinc finger protein [Deltaproteobacteria bacterium]|nr:YgiT-type zinc finger protein [Deltaproteobacteria bacterium]
MFKCHVCNSAEFREDVVDEIFDIEGKHVLVEQIPAKVCGRCGEMTFSRETTERIRRLLHGEGKTKKTITIDVFAYETSMGF